MEALQFLMYRLSSHEQYHKRGGGKKDKKAKMRMAEHSQIVWLNPLQPQGCVFQDIPTGTSVL